MLGTDKFGKRLVQPFLDPVLQRSQSILFVLKLFREAGEKVGLAGDALERHFLKDQIERLGAAASGSRQPVGP